MKKEKGKRRGGGSIKGNGGKREKNIDSWE